MDRASLERFLQEGFSLPEIGRIVGRDPSTVGYWVAKHGLAANGRAKYAPRGGLPRDVLADLVEQGETLKEIAAEVGRSVSTVRYWLSKYELKASWGRRRMGACPRSRCQAPGDDVPAPRRHELRPGEPGYYRCQRCRSAGVSERRRVIKRTLVAEAGGACDLCGYERYVGALHFHHLDPSEKAFTLSLGGVTKSITAIREEAGKCVLLCANCHAEVEAGCAKLPGGRLVLRNTPDGEPI